MINLFKKSPIFLLVCIIFLSTAGFTVYTAPEDEGLASFEYVKPSLVVVYKNLWVRFYPPQDGIMSAVFYSIFDAIDFIDECDGNIQVYGIYLVGDKIE